MRHLSLLLTTLLFPLVAGQTSLPGFNIFPLRNLVVTGLFDGLTFLPRQYQPPNLGYTPTGIYAQHNGTLRSVGNLKLPDRIAGLCTLQVEGRYFLYVGGSFTHIGPVKLRNAGVLDLQSGKWRAVGGGLDEVLTVTCDNQRQAVLFGTKFQAGLTFKPTGGIYDWNHAASKWNPLTFNGVNGPVNSILVRPNSNVVIGGQFTSTLDGLLSANPLSNRVDLRNADVSIFATTDGRLDHPDRLLCDTDQAFTMLDGNLGDILVKFPPRTAPSGLRIWNTGDSDGLERIRVYSEPGSRPIQVSKLAPFGQMHCGTEDCWLDRTSQPQEFIFHDTDPSLTELRIKMVGYYGKRVVIKKLELFGYSAYAPAYPTRPKLEYCRTYRPSGPRVTTTVVEQPSSSTSLPATIIKTLTYLAKFSDSGYYKVSLHKSHACLTHACHELSLVDITISPSFTELGEEAAAVVKKKSISDSLTEVYTGYFKTNFTTSINVHYSYPKGSGTSLDPILGIIIEKTVAHDHLPNLLEFAPISLHSNRSGVVDGFPQVSQPGMEVTALASDQDTDQGRLFVAGSLGGVPLIAQIDSNYNVLMNGVRGDVVGLAVANGTLYAGGSFEFYQSDTLLKYLVQFNLTKRSTWTELPNAATLHPVTSLQNAGSTNLVMTGQFNANRDWSIQEPQLHYIHYNPQLNNVSSYALIDGDLSSITHQPAAEPWTFFVGKIRKSEYMRSTNVAYLSESGSAVPIAATQDNSYNSVMQTATLNTGLMYVPHLSPPDHNEGMAHSPLVVVGGRYSEGKFPGVGIYDGDQWQFLNVGNGQVLTLTCSDNELFIGGDFEGGASNHRLLVYSFQLKRFVNLPTPITNAPTNRVNKLIRQYGTTKIIVAGRFDAPTGSSDCNHLCLLDADLKSWSSLDKPLPAEIQEVVDIVSFENKLVLSSKQLDITNDLHVYDVSASKWSKASLNLPGLPSYLSYDNATHGLFIAGRAADNKSSFLYWWNELKSHNLGHKLASSPHIKQVMVVEKPLTAYDERNLDFKLPPTGAILVSGELVLEGFGPCSGALFNGSVWKPYFTSSRFEKGAVVPGQASVFKMVPFYPRQREYLSTLFIILISLGIALGVLILIIGLGLFLLFFQHKRRQRSRQALVPLLSDIGSPNQTFTTPLASPINPRPIILTDNDPASILMQERNTTLTSPDYPTFDSN